jgi:hypothetical protein
MKNRIINKVNVGLLPERNYNILNNIMKPLKTIFVEKGEYYEISSPFYQDTLFFYCTRSGKIVVKYRHTNGLDHLLLNGEGRLRPEPELTEGMGND